MFKSIITAGALAIAISLVPAHADEKVEKSDPQQSTIPNIFDPNTWSNNLGVDAQPNTAMAFNPAHPSGWAMFFDPATHQAAHRAFTNPANYAQFATPGFYMQFMNPNNWMAWMNPTSYSVFMNPNNYLYWMNPGAYVHGMDMSNYMQFMNPGNYTAFINPATYMQWMNPAAYIPSGTDYAANDGVNWFDPATWTKLMQTQPAEGESGQ